MYTKYLVFIILDLAVTVLSFGLFHLKWNFDFAQISDFVYLNNGYSFDKNPVDLIVLVVIRGILLISAVYLNSSVQEQSQKLLIGCTLFCYSFTLVKLLALSDIPEQLDYPGVRLSITWSLFSLLVVWNLWMFLLKKKKQHISNYTTLNNSSEDLAQANTNNNEKADDKEPQMPTQQLLCHIFKYVRAHKIWFSTGFTLAVVFAISMVMVPLLVGKAVADITRTRSLDTVLWSAMYMIGLTIIIAIISGLRAYTIDYAAAKVYTHIRADLFAKIIKQEIGFFDANKTGELLSRLSSDCESMSVSVARQLNIIVRSGVTMVGALVVMYHLSWRLTTVSFVVIPFNATFIQFFGAYFNKMSSKRQEMISQCNQVAEEVLSSIRTVRSFACEDREIDRFQEKLNDTLEVSKKRAVSYIGYYSTAEICDHLMLTGVVFYGGYLVVTGKMDTAVFVTFLLYQIQLQDSIYVLKTL